MTGGALASLRQPVRAGRKNAIRIEINGVGRKPGVRLRGHERPVVYDHRTTRTTLVPSRPRHRTHTRTSVRGGPRPPARLRACLHPSGGRSGNSDRERTRPAFLRRWPAVQRVLGAVEAERRQSSMWTEIQMNASAHQGRQIQLRTLDRWLEGRRCVQRRRPRAMDPVDAVHRLAELGAAAVTFHDDDLVPDDSQRKRRCWIGSAWRWQKPVCRSRSVRRTCSATRSSRKAALRRTTVRYVATPSPRCCATLIWRPSWCLDLCAVGWARGRRVWGEPRHRSSAGPLREALDLIAGYVKIGIRPRFALEPKPNEPRGDILLPTIGHALALIAELDHGEIVRPEPGGRTRGDGRPRLRSRNRSGAIARKLFHVDLNGQHVPRYDQDFASARAT